MSSLDAVPVQPGRRQPATVAVDLRVGGRAAAVAVDTRGALVAWAAVAGDGDRAALAALAIGKLKVQARAVRLLLGAEAAQVGLAAGGERPGEREIAEALLAEGYPPLAEPAVAAAPAARGTWLVAASDGTALGRLADGLLERTSVEPTFAVDQLLIAARLDDGAAVVEYGEAGLLIAALPPRSAVLVRALPAPAVPAAEAAARECRETLEAAGLEAVRALGERRAELVGALAGSGLEVQGETPPAVGPSRLPSGFELAWRLAVDPGAPALASAGLARRGKSLGWSRRTTRAALVAALVGFLLMAAGLRASWGNRVRQHALAPRAPEIVRQVEQVRRLGTLAETIEQRRAEAAGQTAPWPRLAETVAALARELPADTGWEKLAITDGTLELAATARGAEPREKLEQLRAVLARSPGVLNLSWDEPVADAAKGRVRQVFKATLREPLPAGPEGAP